MILDEYGFPSERVTASCLVDVHDYVEMVSNAAGLQMTMAQYLSMALQDGIKSLSVEQQMRRKEEQEAALQAASAPTAGRPR